MQEPPPLQASEMRAKLVVRAAQSAGDRWSSRIIDGSVALGLRNCVLMAKSGSQGASVVVVGHCGHLELRPRRRLKFAAVVNASAPRSATAFLAQAERQRQAARPVAAW